MNSKDKPTATLTIRSVHGLSKKTTKRLAAWLREQAQTIELQSHELSNTYTARYWNWGLEAKK